MIPAPRNLSPGNDRHAVRLRTREEIGDELREWLAKAYAVGNQQHHGR